MAIELPAKKYYTFPQLAERLQCSEQDLRHLVIEREITPSFHLECQNYADHQIESDEDLDGRHLFPFPVFNWDSKADDPGEWTKLAGFHYLIFPSRTSANNCVFTYFSKTSYGHDVGEICYALDETLGIDFVLKHGVVMKDELARFEALHNKDVPQMQMEKPLATTERNTLLTIIAVLCKEAKLDHTKHAKTAGLIQSTATAMGVSIGETTIENHLKRIPNALAGKTR